MLEPARQHSQKEHVWRTTAEELLYELDHEFSTAMEVIENTLSSTASRWRLIISGAAAAALFIISGACITYCKVLPLCRTNARKEVIIHLNDCKPRERGQLEEESSGSREDTNKPAAPLNATYVPFRILLQ
ncbi:hypothetical protein Tcan_16745 [Toxocara canis]|nr:hypothetical protein Tcan_16745 [Toxocara canis]